MPIDIRAEVAKHYDSNPAVPNDVPFYLGFISSARATVLELGCGTGRVALPLIPHCAAYQGLDISPAMLAIFHHKLADAHVSPSRARADEGDITGFHLGRRFDLLIAPFRVLQNLETDAQVDGLFSCIHEHLAPGGTCVLNVFRPNRDPDGLRQHWVSQEEELVWEVPIAGGRLACYDKRARMDPDKLVLYPEHTYRLYEGDALKEEVVWRLTMRCYYPDTFDQLVRLHGFRVVNRWGGYAGEAYGEGPELVIQFTEPDSPSSHLSRGSE
jgi:SAM-dependent methyltransferase